MRFHPCAALRLPLKGATLADRHSRIGSVLGSDISRRMLGRLVGYPGSGLCASQLGGGHITGMLRVEAVAHRRAPVSLGRAWV